MFSINPAYDYQHGKFAFGGTQERQELYRRCEKEKVGITVMKAFAGGQLLDAKLSPFGQALSKIQCIQYALDKPGVITVLPGFRNPDDLNEVLGYLNATKQERDYSVIGNFAPTDAAGRYVYCSHCHLCPKGLDIATLLNLVMHLPKTIIVSLNFTRATAYAADTATIAVHLRLDRWREWKILKIILEINIL